MSPTQRAWFDSLAIGTFVVLLVALVAVLVSLSRDWRRR